VLLSGLAASACEDGDSPAERTTPDARAADSRPDAGATVVGHCAFENPFSQEAECKEYTGREWTRESARADCDVGQYKTPGRFAAEPCPTFAVLGTCDIDSYFGQEYRLWLGGENADFCSTTGRACTNLMQGHFTPSTTCADRAVPTEPSASAAFVFQWPTQTCRAPLDGEAPGQGPDGQVCTWNLISACTEPDRDFRDYGDCEIVETNRPYYPVPGRAVAGDDDPRLRDPDYLRDSEWMKKQVEACACVCCHTDTGTRGASKWSVDAGPLWTDTMSDTAVALFAGYVDSSVLGAFEPRDNNGFDRLASALPTTDVERTLAFFRKEFQRRGLEESWARELRDIGGPLVEQRDHVPERCTDEAALDADGTLRWSDERGARYLYVLAEGSDNPGMPPNLDLPAGTLWRVSVPHDGTPLASGTVRYGRVPAGAAQTFPVDGAAPPALEAGKRYQLYILADLAVPLARCIVESN
jgi:hypothetical protein